MQLILIIQVSIAVIAGELSGLIPASAAEGIVAAIAGPLLVALRGAMRARGAHRRMDRGDSGGVEAVYASGGRDGVLATVAIAFAACSAMPRELEPFIGGAGVSLMLVASAVAAALARHAMVWSVEKRVRESAIMRGLDSILPIHPMPPRASYVLAQARASLLPMLAPLVVPLALAEAARQAALQIDPAFAEQARFAGGVAGAFILFVLVPFIVPPLLGLTRLAPGEIRDELEVLARHAGVGVREIWVWPTDGLVANAAVMGVLPGLRCVMLSDALLECMNRAEIRAVMAHELGHVVRRHLLWLIAVILACWTLASAATTPAAQALAERYAEMNPADSREAIVQTAVFARDACVLAIGLVLFGFASRRFERQADTFAVQLLSRREGSATATTASVGSMSGALESVARLNHVPQRRASWRHGSIAWRRAYLAGIAGAELDRLPIDRLVTVLCWGSLAVVVAGIALGVSPV